eukprot:CAMPEP_0195079302 /NCGR_PEP_ID=MMETSP0448-20130528/21261_1 /TAXON_ID=66468 /ORGANISM="Heterocapsa triquestra, Strain CCMP 448" /LENGTH=79 /DNA_ID=CAMNT_0040112129 /DNA_START=16 /DNA_END=251 /DNA_ORIENTATION=+
MEGLGSSLSDIVSSLSQLNPNLGDVACADEWSELMLESVGEESISLSTFDLNLEPQATEEVDQLKSNSLGTTQGVAYAL